MTERERLIELLKYAERKMTFEEMVDYLLANGVIKVTKCESCKWWTPQPYSLQGRCELYKSYPTGEWYCANGRADGGEE